MASSVAVNGDYHHHNIVSAADYLCQQLICVLFCYFNFYCDDAGVFVWVFNVYATQGNGKKNEKLLYPDGYALSNSFRGSHTYQEDASGDIFTETVGKQSL